MYESFYHLRQRPFALTPDSAFLFPSATHKRALSYLIYGLGQREGFIVITGDVGTGKTMIIQAMLDYLARKRIHGVRLAAANVDAGDVLPLVANAFDIPPDTGGKAVLQSMIERKINAQYPNGVLLIVDEAQTFSAAALEELRVLVNMNAGGRALMQISLVGQTDLRRTLEAPDMEQLWQRIIAWHHLQALSLAETREYVQHRLRAAGAVDIPQLEEDIYPLLHEWSQGIPRRINIIMDRLLLFGSLEERTRLGRDALHRVIEELSQEFGRHRFEPPNGTSTVDSGRHGGGAVDIQALEQRFERLERLLVKLLGPETVQRFLIDQERDSQAVDMQGGEGVALLARMDRMEGMLSRLQSEPLRHLK